MIGESCDGYGIFGNVRLKKALRSLHHQLALLFGAATQGKQQDQTDGRSDRLKISDLLRLSIFGDDKIFRLELRHRFAAGVQDFDVEVDEARVNLQDFALVFLRRRLRGEGARARKRNPIAVIRIKPSPDTRQQV